MQKIVIFLMACWFLGISLSAQNIQINVEIKDRDPDNPLWCLTGTADLPHMSIVTLRLTYEKNKVLKNNLGIFVKRGKFFYRYRLANRMPSGSYRWEISFRKERQSPKLLSQMAAFQDQTVQHTVMIGSPSLARQEVQEAALYYKTLLREINTFCTELRVQSDLFLKQPKATPIENVSVWLTAAQHRYNKIDNKISESDTLFLEIRSEASMELLLGMLFPLQKLWQARSEVLRKAYQLPFPVGYQELFPKDSQPNFAPLENELARLSQQILSKLPFAENIRELELEADLLWFNQFFQDVQRTYSQMLTAWNLPKWQEKLALWQPEVKDFAAKAEAYTKSPLSVKQPSLPADMTTLAKLGEDLLWGYTEILYTKSRTALPKEFQAPRQPPEKVLLELQAVFGRLYKIVPEKRQQEVVSKSDSLADVQKQFGKIQELEKSLLEEGLKSKDSAAFAQWETKWRTGLDAAQNQVGKLNAIFPDICQEFPGLFYSLAMRVRLYGGFLKTGMPKDPLELSVGLRKYELLFYKSAKQVKAKLAEAAQSVSVQEK